MDASADWLRNSLEVSLHEGEAGALRRRAMGMDLRLAHEFASHRLRLLPNMLSRVCVEIEVGGHLVIVRSSRGRRRVKSFLRFLQPDLPISCPDALSRVVK